MVSLLSLLVCFFLSSYCSHESQRSGPHRVILMILFKTAEEKWERGAESLPHEPVPWGISCVIFPSQL